MTHSRMREEIREACAKANPSIKALVFGYQVIGRPVRLADVIMAIAQVESDPYQRTPKFLDVIDRWDLLRDDLDLQTDATVEFIRSLIKE